MDERPSILLIEDSRSEALRVQLTLERFGYRVRVAAGGLAGWRAACAQLPRLILLDVDLPTLDGFQVLSRLKRGHATKNIPVVMLTHRAHVSDVERAIALRADDYLFKEDIMQQLCAVVDHFLRPAELPRD